MGSNSHNAVMQNMVMDIFHNGILDIIYPPRCHICRKFLRTDRIRKDRKTLPICRACLNNFSEITSPHCPVCSRPFDTAIGDDHPCEGCLRHRPLYDRLGAPYLYDGVIMEAVHALKYGGRTGLVDALGPVFVSFAKDWLEKDESVIMPVPLHPKRLRERGFNQSLLLARQVASAMHAELDYLSLRRIRYTKPQAGLKSDERRKNVRRAFGLANGINVKNRTVILVDDVATTGNTLNECARVLKKDGCKKVLCLVLARTSGR